MISEDFIRLVIEKNAQAIQKNRKVSAEISEHKKTLIQQKGNFNQLKIDNSKIHEERLRRLKSIQRQ